MFYFFFVYLAKHSVSRSYVVSHKYWTLNENA